MLKHQIENPTKGDWASICVNDIKELDLEKSLEEIKFMTKQKFISILKEEKKNNSFGYLNNKRGKKGKEIQYSCLEMCEYLLLTSTNLTIEQKRESLQ